MQESTERYLALSFVADELMAAHLEVLAPETAGQIEALRRSRSQDDRQRGDAVLVATIGRFRSLGQMPEAAETWLEAGRIVSLPESQQGRALVESRKKIIEGQLRTR